MSANYLTLTQLINFYLLGIMSTVAMFNTISVKW